MKIKALVPAHFAEELARRTEDLPVDLIAYDKDGSPLGDATGASALFRWWLTTEQGDRLLDSYPLRWIHSGSAGIDHILTPRFLASGIQLTNSSGVHAPSIAEWVVGALLFVEKDFALMLRQQQERSFEKVERAELTGRSVVILGGGNISAEIAKRLRPFGVGLTCVRRTADLHPLFDRTVSLGEMREVLHDADWFVIAVPLSAETRGLVNDEVLSALPSRACVVNVARGEIVDERALLQRLQKKQIAGAVLDVFEEEPLPAGHPFWSMSNVLVLPHTTWRSPLVRERQLALFVENLRRFARGDALINTVDPKRGY